MLSSPEIFEIVHEETQEENTEEKTQDKKPPLFLFITRSWPSSGVFSGTAGRISQ